MAFLFFFSAFIFTVCFCFWSQQLPRNRNKREKWVTASACCCWPSGPNSNNCHWKLQFRGCEIFKQLNMSYHSICPTENMKTLMSQTSWWLNLFKSERYGCTMSRRPKLHINRKSHQKNAKNFPSQGNIYLCSMFKQWFCMFMIGKLKARQNMLREMCMLVCILFTYVFSQPYADRPVVVSARAPQTHYITKMQAREGPLNKHPHHVFGRKSVTVSKHSILWDDAKDARKEGTIQRSTMTFE